MMFPKPSTIRDPQYLAWIRELPCISCGAPGPSQPHHEGEHGIGIKASDHFTLPLCPICHRERHDYGVKTFWRNHDPARLIMQIREIYKSIGDD